MAGTRTKAAETKATAAAKKITTRRTPADKTDVNAELLTAIRDLTTAMVKASTPLIVVGAADGPVGTMDGNNRPIGKELVQRLENLHQWNHRMARDFFTGRQVIIWRNGIPEPSFEVEGQSVRIDGIRNKK